MRSGFYGNAAAFLFLIGQSAHAFKTTDGNDYHSGIIQVAAGVTHTCALMADFHVSCWGTSPVALSLTPLPVPGLDRAIKVVSGNNFACALLIDHTVSCWGDNSFGQLGDGTHTSRPNNPAPVLLGPDAFDDAENISAGGSHVCAVKGADAEAGLTHTVWCWGLNTSAQLGNYTVPHVDFRQPIRVVIHDDVLGDAFLSGVESVAAGFAHTCVLFAGSNKLACWGANNRSQVGNVEATSDIVDSPVAVKTYDDSGDLVDFVSGGGLATGGFHTCALINVPSGDKAFGVACWGSDDYDQISYRVGTTAVPAEVTYGSATSPLRGFSYISLGENFSCALDGGGVMCWGEDIFGEIGDDRFGCVTTSCPIPVRTFVGDPSESVSSGSQHVCAWTYANIYCWGRNDSGQLGTGSSSMGPHSAVISKVDAPIFTDNLDGN